MVNCRVDMGAIESTIIVPGNGDVDGSGAVNLQDVPVFVGLLLGTGMAANPCAADMNGDGAVDGKDLRFLVAALIGT